jgi:hypothetical protein
MKSRTRWEGHVEGMSEKINAYVFLWEARGKNH